jgi:hypothetical protein
MGFFGKDRSMLPLAADKNSRALAAALLWGLKMDALKQRLI